MAGIRRGVEEEAHRPARGDAAGTAAGRRPRHRPRGAATGRARWTEVGVSARSAWAHCMPMLVAEIVRPANRHRQVARPVDADLAGERAGVLEDAVERGLQHRREILLALQRRGDRVRGGKVPVRVDEPALGPVEDGEDPEGEEHGAAAHDQGGEHVGRVGRDARVDPQVPEELEAPDEGDREEDAHPLRAREQAKVALWIHGSTVPRSTRPFGRADRPHARVRIGPYGERTDGRDVERGAHRHRSRAGPGRRTSTTGSVGGRFSVDFAHDVRSRRCGRSR